MSLTRHEQSAPALGGTPEQTPGGCEEEGSALKGKANEDTSACFLADSWDKLMQDESYFQDLHPFGNKHSMVPKSVNCSFVLDLYWKLSPVVCTTSGLADVVQKQPAFAVSASPSNGYPSLPAHCLLFLSEILMLFFWRFGLRLLTLCNDSTERISSF